MSSLISTDPKSRCKSGLASLHRAALRKLLHVPVAGDSLRNELEMIRKRKALLVGDIKRFRHGICADDDLQDVASSHAVTSTVADELQYVDNRADYTVHSIKQGDNELISKATNDTSKWANREYLHKYDDLEGIGLVANSRKRKREVAEVNNAVLLQELTAQNMAKRLNDLRTKRRIAAAHRLAGVSALSTGGDGIDDNVLGAQIDICLHGNFVARYHVFFDVVMVPSPFDDSGDSGRDGVGTAATTCAIVRLAQHTMPVPGVAVCPILEKNFGPDGTLEVVDKMETSGCHDVVDKIGRSIGDFYDACHSFAMRRDACQYLRKRETLAEEKGFQIKNVAHNDASDRISFDVVTGNISDNKAWISFTIQLCYDDQMVARPTSVRIVPIQVEEDAHESAKYTLSACFIDDVRLSLLSHSIPIVLEKNIEWPCSTESHVRTTLASVIS